MDTAETVYLATVGLYLVFFALFCRYVFWRREAYKKHWSRRRCLSIAEVEELARLKGQPLPYISILIPAKGEADVIECTIRHMAALEYPTDRFELVVITDEKEMRGKDKPYPTTQEVVESTRAALGREGVEGKPAPRIVHVSVPYDFEGRLHGPLLGHEVPSTKGRALNYGLDFVSQQSDICAFYDAESRPEKQVLLWVAWRSLANPEVQIWQGPVFQVRNYYYISAINKVVALYQAISHAWYLPVLMRKLPFVGGTNFFARRQLLERVGGFDHHALTEDLEFGVRSALEFPDAWPEYMPYWSTEQTPATYMGYFRQRLRWGSGHLQVTAKFRESGQYPWDRRRPLVHNLYWKGEGEWLFYQLAVIASLSLGGVFARGLLHVPALPWGVIIALRIFTLVYFAFTFYLYFYFRAFMLPPPGKGLVGLAQRWLGVAELLLLPLAGILMLAPYSAALLLKFLNRQPQVWVKTPRTREVFSRAGGLAK